MLVAATAALDGLLFGYDAGIISGALLFIREAFALSDAAQQTVVGSLLFGAVLGALVAGPLNDRAGRRTAILAAASFSRWARWSRRWRPARGCW